MKQLAMLGAVIFGAIGSYVPVLFTDDINALIGWGIFGSLVGGLFGIWVAVKFYNAIG